MARNWWRWKDHLNQVLSIKPAEVVQEACQVLEKHGCPVRKELKSELYYSSTLCPVVFQVLHYANLIVAHAPTVWAHTNTHLYTYTHTRTHTHIYLSGISAFWAVGFLRKFYNRPKWTFLEGKCSLFTAEG